MNSAWSVEFSRIFMLLCSTLLFGVVSDYWILSVVIHSSFYIGWNLFQLRALEKWISLGAPSESAPDASGIWELIVQRLYRMQKANQETKAHLSSVAGHYHAVMSALPDATIVLNRQQEIEWTNSASQALLGIEAEHDIGHKLTNIVRDSMLTELLNVDYDKQELEIISPIDELKTLVLTKVHYGDGKTLITARDISQRIALQKLRKAFIANASHELRTPLTVISGYLEMLESDDSLPPTTHKIVNNAYVQSQRMDKILNDLLVLSKLEEKGYSESSGDTVDIPVLIKRMVSDLRDTKAKGTHTIELNIQENLLVRVVENEFYSLCQNLLSNAIKYSPSGSVIKVCWSLNEEGSACLKVSDNGEGIARESLSRLTERFFRVNVNRTRKVKGTGLGLSIVKHILENYGGFLDVQSELTVGSTFSACFPSYRIV